jgi:uncharacterized phage-associated protein
VKFFKLDTVKVVQAIGVILRNQPHHVASKLRILKLLYIADREAIAERGRPIVGAKTVAMDHGPLHSGALDLMNGETLDAAEFSSHFDRRGYMIEHTANPGVDHLSRYEIEKLNELCDRYMSVSDWDLAHEITHAFPEWIAHFKPGTSTAIPIQSIVEAVAKPNDAAAILNDLESEMDADSLFGARSM